MGAMFGKIAVETPKYEVLVTKPLYEIRKYAPFVMVSTTTEDMVGGNSSFSRLARYIGVFGKAENSTQETISMTAPVMTGLGPSMVNLSLSVFPPSLPPLSLYYLQHREVGGFMRCKLPSLLSLALWN
jgi:hypothetical protein